MPDHDGPDVRDRVLVDGQLGAGNAADQRSLANKDLGVIALSLKRVRLIVEILDTISEFSMPSTYAQL